jgi:hypothetical protein
MDKTNTVKKKTQPPILESPSPVAPSTVGPPQPPPETRASGEKVLDLGQGLQLWKVPIAALREQDVNARSMSKPMFERLSQTIARDKRLESLPFCARTDKAIEIVSGHHRARAAIAAGLTEMFVMVDVTGLTRSQI